MWYVNKMRAYFCDSPTNEANANEQRENQTKRKKKIGKKVKKRAPFITNKGKLDNFHKRLTFRRAQHISTPSDRKRKRKRKGRAHISMPISLLN